MAVQLQRLIQRLDAATERMQETLRQAQEAGTIDANLAEQIERRRTNAKELEARARKYKIALKTLPPSMLSLEELQKDFANNEDAFKKDYKKLRELFNKHFQGTFTAITHLQNLLPNRNALGQEKKADTEIGTDQNAPMNRLLDVLQQMEKLLKDLGKNG